jgi:EAL domain-containing protein (putative c-di-GMP-specific phosphodiesterase class I)
MDGARTTQTNRRCGDCAGGIAPPFPFTMAFQPMVDIRTAAVFAYEALVRGPAGEPAAAILKQVTLANRYAFDQSCRVKAIEIASRLRLAESGASLSINFIPGAMYRPETCIQATFAATRRHDFPPGRVIFEMTENEEVTDHDHLHGIMRAYREHGMRTAIDDFGAGFSGLGLLANFHPDIVKIDMMLLRGLDTDSRRRAIVSGIVGTCRALGVTVVAEGVETVAELAALRSAGIALFQGHLFARAGFETLPPVAFS